MLWATLNTLKIEQDKLNYLMDKSESPHWDYGMRQTIYHIVDVCPQTHFKREMKKLHGTKADVVR